MPRLTKRYAEVMESLQNFIIDNNLSRIQMRELYNIFDNALKCGYLDGVGDLSDELAQKKANDTTQSPKTLVD